MAPLPGKNLRAPITDEELIDKDFVSPPLPFQQASDESEGDEDDEVTPSNPPPPILSTALTTISCLKTFLERSEFP